MPTKLVVLQCEYKHSVYYSQLTDEMELGEGKWEGGKERLGEGERERGREEK